MSALSLQHRLTQEEHDKNGAIRMSTPLMWNGGVATKHKSHLELGYHQVFGGESQKTAGEVVSPRVGLEEGLEMDDTDVKTSSVASQEQNSARLAFENPASSDDRISTNENAEIPSRELCEVTISNDVTVLAALSGGSTSSGDLETPAHEDGLGLLAATASGLQPAAEVQGQLQVMAIAADLKANVTTNGVGVAATSEELIVPVTSMVAAMSREGRSDSNSSENSSVVLSGESRSDSSSLKNSSTVLQSKSRMSEDIHETSRPGDNNDQSEGAVNNEQEHKDDENYNCAEAGNCVGVGRQETRKRRHSDFVHQLSSNGKKPINDVPDNMLAANQNSRYGDVVTAANNRSHYVDGSDLHSEDVNDEDDDVEDDDDDVKLHAKVNNSDPERLKAFNLFVRLFIDENLDRSVPISKQPKEKIQAILDACDRQFGEFHDRARKRVRTYLKSCRRLRRSKDGAEQIVRPTPPHLTSVIAETILALACDNEANNAKRMRCGLEPLPNKIPTPIPASCTSALFPSPGLNSSHSIYPSPTPTPASTPTPRHPPSSSSSFSSSSTSSSSLAKHERLSPTNRVPAQLPRDTGGSLLDDAVLDFSTFNSSSIGNGGINYSGFPPPHFPPFPLIHLSTPEPPAARGLIQGTGMVARDLFLRDSSLNGTAAAGKNGQRLRDCNEKQTLQQRSGENNYCRPASTVDGVNNGRSKAVDSADIGPTDLSLRKRLPESATSANYPRPRYSPNRATDDNLSAMMSAAAAQGQLNAMEILTVRQLIVSYRESAAFLYRSAEELEILLLHQS